VGERGPGLWIRGVPIASATELAVLRGALGADLEASATVRAWLAGEDVAPHSVGVALETQARMLFDEPPEVRGLLLELLGRIVEAFPEEVAPLDL